MDISTIFFYLIATLLVFSSLAVVLNANPIFSALFLAITMIGLSTVYFMLNAFFIAGIQLIVYAGAVIILFVMVLMIFDLKKEEQLHSQGPLGMLLRMTIVGWLCGLIVGGISLAQKFTTAAQPSSSLAGTDSTESLARLIFTDYLFSFEVLGVLLLLIAVGAVAMSRAKGGTHA